MLKFLIPLGKAIALALGCVSIALAFADTTLSEPDTLSESSYFKSDSASVSSPEFQIGTLEWKSTVLTRIALNDEETTEKVVEELVASRDPEFYDLLVALYNGMVYKYDERIEESGLVITGDEVEGTEGEVLVKIYSLLPEKHPLINSEGKEELADPYVLEEIETGRALRVMISPYLQKVRLFLPDPKKRRLAAERMGDEDGEGLIALLDSAMETEKLETVRLSMSYAKAKIMFRNGELNDQLEAVGEFERIKNPLAIPVLESYLENNQEPTALVKQVKKTLVSLRSHASIMQGIQTLFTGISLGSVLILIALGLAVIYGLMGVINMAHGEFMMIGAYTTFVIQSIMDPIVGPKSELFYWLAAPMSFVIAGLVGILLEETIIKRLYNRPLESLLATWGVSLLLIQTARSIFGDLTSVRMPASLSGGYELAPQVILPYNRLFIILLTLVALLGLFIVFYRTRFGLNLRGVVQNRAMASCVGVSVRKVDRMTFFMGSGIAGLAGWAITLIGNVVPDMGQTYVVDSFLVVVTGGVGKLLGTVISGFGIGVTTKFLEPIFEAVYSKAIILGLIILFLQIRPTGIFPNKGRTED